MAKPIHRLSNPAIDHIIKDADAQHEADPNKRVRVLAADGGGLWLRVQPPHGCSWLFRYARGGASHDVGLGPYPTRTLNRAREIAAAMRVALVEGQDPRTVLSSTKPIARAVISTSSPQPAPAKSGPTFAEVARDCMSAHDGGWSPTHAKQWRDTLARFVYPTIGAKPVDKIDTDDVLSVLEPLWSTVTETASRVRGRIETVLDFATAKKLRSGENPARWKGNLQHLLGNPDKIAVSKPMEALPYADVPALMQQLRDERGNGALALQFCVLTATRTGEVRDALWSEIDLSAKTWTIPGERMKGGREHVVPLSPPALEILDRMAKARKGEFVFPGDRTARVGVHVMLKMAKRLTGHEGLTVHGFRSTFRDWCAEHAHPRDLAEMSIAHKIGNAVEQAYFRSKLINQRRAIMDEWGAFVAGVNG
jgi:integrase